ncbi:hypothetical protein OS493_021993 [Desmophyllum pertusum]|uniref:Uncharacterized protein n=1 Tax=Desmophyllum pertusum TaxID=174260 RepID=A0A9W9YYM1_9CNID|nr:hypothetical protein OS493_021993 [Desmophyllum pertusum]
MEQVALNNVQLDYLAREDEALKPYFHGTVACDRLPKKPSRNPCGYIVNTDTHDKPGRVSLVGCMDRRQREQGDGQLRPSPGNLRDNKASTRVDCETLEVRGDEHQVSASRERYELWSLRFGVLERQRACPTRVQGPTSSQPIPSLPWTRPHRLNPEELKRQLEMLLNDQRQSSVGRRIPGIMTTNTITTTYKDGGPPIVRRASSSIRN